MSDHNWVLENLESYHAGGLNSAERERLEGHLGKCGACAKALQEIRGLDNHLEGLFAASRPEPGLEDRMIRSLRVGGCKSKSRLPVIGWIGLSAAAAVILAVVGALMQYAVLREGPPVDVEVNVEKVLARVWHSVLRETPSTLKVAIDNSGSMAGEDRDQIHRPKNAQFIPSVDADIDEMASRLREETVAEVEGQPGEKKPAFASIKDGTSNTIMVGERAYDDTGRPNGSMGVDAAAYDGTHRYAQIDYDQKKGKLEGEQGQSVGRGWTYRQYLNGGIAASKGDGEGSGGTIINNGSLQPGLVSGFQPIPNPAYKSQSSMTGGLAAPKAGGEASAAEAPSAGLGFYPPSRALVTGKPAQETKKADGKEAGRDGFGPPILSKIPYTNRLDANAARKRLETAQDLYKRAQEVAQSGAVSEQFLNEYSKALEEAKKEIHTYRNDAVAAQSNEYFRPGEQAKADVEKLLKELGNKVRSETVTKGKEADEGRFAGDSKSPAKADKGVAVGLGNKAGFATGFDIPPNGKQDQKPGKPDTAPAGPRKIVIRSGDIEFEVDSFDSAVATVTLLVNKIQGGFVATVNSEKLKNGKVKGEVVVRMPPESLDGFVLELRKELGKTGELKGQKIGSKDITEQYTDLESELKAARAMEERLLQIIKSGKGEIKDLVAAEKELGDRRTQIEKLEGRLRYYGNLVALSTLTINLAEKEILSPFAVIKTERIQMGVEVEDVIKAQQQVVKAVEEVKGRVTKSELKQHAAGQLNCLIHFEVAPENAGPLRDRIEQLGKRTRLEIEDLQETEGGTGKPGEIKTRRKDTQFMLSLYNVANVAARETTHLKLACVDAEDVYKKILDRVGTAKGRVVTSNLDRQRNDQTSGLIQFEVKSADAGAVLLFLKELGEVMRLQVIENPEAQKDVQNVTRSKQGFNVEVLALGKVDPRETTCIQLATRDVPAGYAAIKDAVTKAKGRIAVAQLNEQNKQNVTAQLDFEIRRADEAAVSAAMTAAGDIFSRNVTRAAESDNVVDSKVRWQVLLINQDQIAPRETTTLGIEVNNVDKTAADFVQLATASKGRVVGSDVARERTGRTTAKLILTVPLSAAPALVDKFRAVGTVRVQRRSENPQVPESDLAVARLDVTLSNAPLVPSDEGIGPQLRKGLSTSLGILFLSLSWLLFGLLVVLPWVLVIYAIFRLVMRMRRKPATVPTA